MRKSILMKLLVLTLCAAMLLSLFACGKEEDPTEEPTVQETEKPTEKEDDKTTEKPTEAPTTGESEEDSKGEESAEGTGDGDSQETESGDSQETTGGSTDDDPQETTGGDSQETTGGSTGGDSQETTGGSTGGDSQETTGGSTGGDSQETEPACDGNHHYVAKGPTGHYCDKCGLPSKTNPIIKHSYEDKDGVPTCSVCGYEAPCKGVHETYVGDENGHWTAACNDCGAAAGTTVSDHTYKYENGKYACTVCGWTLTCDGKHALISDGAEGHHTAACEICNIEEGAVEPHKFTNSVCECGYEAACKGQHDWVMTEEGHSGAACDICGMPATDNEPHTEDGSDYIVDGNYVYGCKECGYAKYTKELTEDVKAFYGPVVLAASNATYYKVNREVKVGEDKVPYASFSGMDVTAQILFMRAHEDTSYQSKAADSEQGKLDIGNATYLVIKLRTNAADQALVIDFSTTGKNSETAVAEEAIVSQDGKELVAAGATYNKTTGYSDVKLPMDKAVVGEWTTFVIDLAKALPSQMVKDSETGTYIVDTLYFHLDKFAAENVIDVAYMAFVEGAWAEIGANVEEETAVSVTKSNSGAIVDPTTGSCVGEHNLSTTVVDGEYKSACSCGYVKSSYGIKEEGPNKVIAAESLVSIGGITGRLDRELVYDDDGTAYVRYDNFGVNVDNWGGWQTSASGVSGQYMILKYRIGNNGVGQTSLAMWINSTKSNNTVIGTDDKGNDYKGTWDRASMSLKVSEDNEWHYVVVDLSARVKTGGFLPDDDGTYSVNYIHFRPFGVAGTAVEDDGEEGASYVYVYTYEVEGVTKKTQLYTRLTADEEKEKGYTLSKIFKMGVSPEAYMDISYFAFCDDLADVKNIVAAETYEWSVDGSTNALRNTEDNSCAEHSYTEVIEGTTHKIVCSLCKTEIRSFEVSADINWYSPLNAMDKYVHNLEKMLYDEEEQVMFNRYTGVGGNHINITGGNAAGSLTTDAFTTGKYIVIKYRASNTTLSFNIATGDKKDGNGHSVGEQSSKNVPGDEWRVAIIDASENAEWTSDGSEQSIYMMITTSSTKVKDENGTEVSQQYTVDIAYVAVVDSIDEMKTLLGEGETYFDYGKSFANVGVEYYQDGSKVPCKEGECVTDYVVTVTDGENGAKIYAYNCVKCGSTISSKVVPANATFFTPKNIATKEGGIVVNPEAEKAEQYATKNTLNVTNPYQATNLACSIENGVPFAKFNGTKSKAEKADSNETIQMIWVRSQEDNAGNLNAPEVYTIDLAQAKYLLIKMRASIAGAGVDPEGEDNDVSVVISSKGGVGANSYYLPISKYQTVDKDAGTVTGKWVTYVFDLATLMPQKWVVNEATGTYVLDCFYMSLCPFLTTDSVEMEYIAFVENWSDVKTLAGEEENVAKITGHKTYEALDFDDALPGTKPEKPIEVTFTDNAASATVPANTTMYFSIPAGIPAGMELFADGAKVAFTTEEGVAKFSITNDSAEDKTYALEINAPVGSELNPVVIGEVIDDAITGEATLTANGSYYFTFTAIDDGTITFAIDGAAGEIAVTVGGTTKTLKTGEGELAVEVKAGDVLTIKITAEADGEFGWEGNLTYPSGSKKNPVVLKTEDFVWEKGVGTCSVEVLEGTTVYVKLELDESVTVLVADQAPTYEEGLIKLSSVEGGSFEITASYPVGSDKRPVELVAGDNTVELAGATEAYYLTWTCTDERGGKLTLTSNANAIQYKINDGELAAVAGEIAVNNGDVVTVVISSEAAASVAINVKFVPTHECLSNKAACDEEAGECTICGEAMEPAGAAHSEPDADGKCTVCGKKLVAVEVTREMALKSTTEGYDSTTKTFTGDGFTVVTDGNVSGMVIMAANKTLTVSANEISKIEITASTGAASLSAETEGVTVTVEGTVCTITVNEGTTLSEIVLKASAQVRVTGIKITFMA